ncbi:hypothetical protein GBO34_00860 [Roseivirga pacifica]|uniref:hypothetical protein n=1 Tax=Roseivirga pacifica TaxID=1267423 RepID=UPI0020956A45|nr:hypothetical protein [Roseivirga pacifica]MCO6367863.1 hypothetical protein [Roseivirga pacifica]MCO6377235.1 hypothetical protein [Roseivirga pacifica]
MEAVIIPEIQTELNSIAHSYAARFQQSVKSALANNKFKDTGHLSVSAKARVIPATERTAPEIVVEYFEYGEYLGKRKLIFTKQPPVSALVPWVKRKIGNSDLIPGYRQGVTPGISEDKRATRIAFAISKQLKFRQKFTRRYKWKREALLDVLRSMNLELEQAWANKTAQLLAQSLSTTNTLNSPPF